MTTLPKIHNPHEAARTLTSLRGWLLGIVSSEERIPAAKAAMVPVALYAAKRQLEPTTPEILAVEIRKLGDWAKAFSIPASDLKTAAVSYTEALSHLPPDLLAEAFRTIRATHKWGMRLPLPSEILNSVAEQMAERRSLLLKLEMAKRCPVEGPSPKATEAERQRVAEIMRQWRSKRDTTATAN